METTLLVCFDIDEENEVEILLPVTFTASKGYPATHWEPGAPDEIDDVAYDKDNALEMVEAYLGHDDFDPVYALDKIDGFLADPETEAKLMDFANQAGIDYEEDRAEYLRDQREDR